MNEHLFINMDENNYSSPYNFLNKTYIDFMTEDKPKVVKPKPKNVTIQITESEYDIIKMALKYYNNHYSLLLLKRLQKSEI